MPKRGQLARRTAALLCLAALSGCGAFADSLKAREAVVHFTADATAAERAAARSACLIFPRVSPEPVATDALSLRSKLDIRYRVDDADDHDLAVLYACLQGQPEVLTIDTRPVNDSNNG